MQLHDTRFGAADAAKKGIADALGRLVAKGRLARADADAAIGRIATVVTLPDVCVAELVIEAIVEDLAAKRELFARARERRRRRLHPGVEHVVVLDHGARPPG